MDAVLCGAQGVSSAVAYVAEAARVLSPGGTFFLLSLGLPAARAQLFAAAGQHLWTSISVKLLPKPSTYRLTQSRVVGQSTLAARPAVDKSTPTQALGPFQLDAMDNEVEAQSLDLSDFFFAFTAVRA